MRGFYILLKLDNRIEIYKIVCLIYVSFTKTIKQKRNLQECMYESGCYLLLKLENRIEIYKIVCMRGCYLLQKLENRKEYNKYIRKAHFESQ